MHKHQANPQEVDQALLDCGATPEQIRVMDAESALAFALEIFGTSIDQKADYDDVDLIEVTDLSSSDDARSFTFKKIGADCRAAHWVATALSDIAESINSESGEQLTCVTSVGINHIVRCMQDLAKAVETLPESEIYV